MHITGLPYNQNNETLYKTRDAWTIQGGKTEWINNNVLYMGQDATLTFNGFHIPTGKGIKTDVSYYLETYTATRFSTGKTQFYIGQDEILNVDIGGTAKTTKHQSTYEYTFTNTLNSMLVKSPSAASTWAGSHSRVYYIGVVYK